MAIKHIEFEEAVMYDSMFYQIRDDLTANKISEDALPKLGNIPFYTDFFYNQVIQNLIREIDQ